MSPKDLSKEQSKKPPVESRTSRVNTNPCKNCGAQRKAGSKSFAEAKKEAEKGMINDFEREFQEWKDPRLHMEIGIFLCALLRLNVKSVPEKPIHDGSSETAHLSESSTKDKSQRPEKKKADEGANKEHHVPEDEGQTKEHRSYNKAWAVILKKPTIQVLDIHCWLSRCFLKDGPSGQKPVDAEAEAFYNSNIPKINMSATITVFDLDCPARKALWRNWNHKAKRNNWTTHEEKIAFTEDKLTAKNFAGRSRSCPMCLKRYSLPSLTVSEKESWFEELDSGPELKPFREHYVMEAHRKIGFAISTIFSWKDPEKEARSHPRLSRLAWAEVSESKTPDVTMMSRWFSDGFLVAVSRGEEDTIAQAAWVLHRKIQQQFEAGSSQTVFGLRDGKASQIVVDWNAERKMHGWAEIKGLR